MNFCIFLNRYTIICYREQNIIPKTVNKGTSKIEEILHSNKRFMCFNCAHCTQLELYEHLLIRVDCSDKYTIAVFNEPYNKT